MTAEDWPGSGSNFEGDELSHDEHPAGDDGPFTMEVDGETFTVAVRPGDPNTYDYSWESGPNSGYGYSSSLRAAYGSIQDRAASPSGFAPLTVEDHRSSIRKFLSQVNPETGYIGD